MALEPAAFAAQPKRPLPGGWGLVLHPGSDHCTVQGTGKAHFSSVGVLICLNIYAD